MQTASPWSWHPHPMAWLAVAGLASAYVVVVRKLGPRSVAPGSPTVSRGEAAAFAAGLAAMLLASEWPIHDLAEGWWYSVHMVQHMLITLVVPPLLILGTPAWLARLLLRPRALFTAFSWLTRPLIALVAFNGLLVLTHWPVMVEASVGSEPVHFAIHAVIFASAVVMWWPVTSPLPELPRLSYPGRIVYLFLQSLVPTIPASFLTFGRAPLYHVYETFPRLLGVSALSDQRVAGLIMKLAGGMLLWGVITVLFFRWYAEEHASDGWDALSFRDVERDVRAGMKQAAAPMTTPEMTDR